MLLDNLPDASTLLNSLLLAFPDLLVILDDQGIIQDYRAGQPSLLFTSQASPVGSSFAELLPPSVADDFTRAFTQSKQAQQIKTIDYPVRLEDVEHWFETKLIPSAQRQVIVVLREITKYKLAEEKTQRQLKRLAALRAIDLAISSSLDLNLALSLILSQITAQLNADAACILLLNPQNNLLEFASGVGFRTEALHHTRLEIGESHAGQAALNGKMVSIPNLHSDGTEMLRSPKFIQEDFYSYFGVPLIAKGQVRGVLEIFQRTRLSPDLDWLDFMETLAGQAAIALEKAVLVKQTQQNHTELTRPY